MRRSSLVIAFATLPLLACADMDPSAPAVHPVQTLSTATVLDGLHNGGNPHFFFLPPLVRNPKANGTFNPDLLPVAVMCALGDGGVCADPQPAGFPLRFSMQGSGPAAIRLNEADEHYAFNLQTGRYPLDPGVAYRIRVFPVEGGAALGHIDVRLVARGTGRGGTRGRGAQTGNDVVQVQQGSTLPVRFRIEQGIACSGIDDCAEVVVGTEGATVVTPEAFAGVDIPEGALDAPVLISVERVDVRLTPCLPSDFIQAEGCYRYDTDPALNEVQESGVDEFNTHVVVGICIDPDVLALPEHHQYALHKFDPDRPDLGIVQLAGAPVDYLDCDGFSSLALSGGGSFMRLARAGWQRLAPLARMLGPARAYAVNLGFGGLTKSFSNIGWARGLAFEVLAGDGQTGRPGARLPVDPVVRVTATHWDPEESDGAPPVEGIEVTFTFTDPAGAATVALDTTDAAGIASVQWVLGEGAGENTLSVSGATASPAVLQATAEADPLVLESIAAGGTFACGLDPDGFAYCWGANPGGVLGNGTLEPSTTPVAVGDGESFIRFEALTLGEAHACGISLDGVTYCWGSNANGQLGIGSFEAHALPQPVPGHSFQQISAGLVTTCAIDMESQVYCWGANQGALGVDTDGGDSSVPRLAAGGMQFQAVTTAFFHTCAIGLDALAYCWGAADQIGAPIDDPITFDPVPVAGELSVTQISAGASTTCAVTAGGEAYCWGVNQFGEAGNGSFDPTPTPVRTALPGVVQSIDMQHHNSLLQFGCALVADIAYCWGSNHLGQLGVGTVDMDECVPAPSFSFACTPHPMPLEGRWRALSVGRQHVCAIGEDDGLYCWGDNSFGQFGDGTTESSSVPRRITLSRP